MTFVLGSASRARLTGVHPKLVAVVELAITITTQDFVVQDGLRTVAQQRELVKRGASKTMNSKHLPQADGLGHAVDLVPFINGMSRWEWGAIWPIADAVDRAATQLKVPVIWGAIWDKQMSAYGGGVAQLKAEVEAYKKRHAGSDFLDGPHYQLAGALA